MTIKHDFVKSLWLILASYFRTTVRNGYNTVLLDQIYVNLRILTYIVKWDVPCLVLHTSKIGKKPFSWISIVIAFSASLFHLTEKWYGLYECLVPLKVQRDYCSSPSLFYQNSCCFLKVEYPLKVVAFLIFKSPLMRCSELFTNYEQLFLLQSWDFGRTPQK